MAYSFFKKSREMFEKIMSYCAFEPNFGYKQRKGVREIVHQLKLEFYYVDKKVEDVIRSNITPIIVSHIFFFFFRVQIELKLICIYYET